MSLSSPARSFWRKLPWSRRWRSAPTSASSTRSSAACCGARLHVLALLLARQRDGDLDEVAHDLLDVAADIADLGELGRLDLEERRAGEPGEPAGDLGLADAGRPDHQNVLRQHLLAQPLVELQPPPAVAQRDGDGALGVGLADDEAVELGDDFARGEVGHASRTMRSAAAVGRIAPDGLPVKSGFFVGADGARVAQDRDRSRRAARPLASRRSTKMRIKRGAVAAARSCPLRR